MKHDDDRDASNPCGPDLGPHIWTLERPWRKQHDKLVRLFQKFTNILFKLGPNVYIRFVEKGASSQGRNLLGDLASNPSIFPRMTDEDKSRLGSRGHDL